MNSLFYCADASSEFVLSSFELVVNFLHTKHGGAEMFFIWIIVIKFAAKTEIKET